MSRAAPSTTSRAAAVITSRALAAASRRNRGLSSQMPAAISPASDATPMPRPSQRDWPPWSTATGDMNATTASSGTISRSSNSNTATIFWPRGSATSPRSASSCMTIAVDVRTKPAAAMNAAGRGSPSAMPTPSSAATQTPICSEPSPKIWRRSFHRWDGRISRPMTNRNMTTPSSATCSTACGSENRPRPNGPIARPAAR